MFETLAAISSKGTSTTIFPLFLNILLSFKIAKNTLTVKLLHTCSLQVGCDTAFFLSKACIARLATIACYTMVFIDESLRPKLVEVS